MKLYTHKGTPKTWDSHKTTMGLLPYGTPKIILPHFYKRDSYIMKHSPTTISDMAESIVAINNEIEDIILIGEKVAAINEAANIYNEMQTLVTVDYFTDEEYDVLMTIGNSWSKCIQEYATTLQSQSGIKEEHNENLEELEDQIRDALNDLFNDNNGNFDGGDGIC